MVIAIVYNRDVRDYLTVRYGCSSRHWIKRFLCFALYFYKGLVQNTAMLLKIMYCF